MSVELELERVATAPPALVGRRQRAVLLAGIVLLVVFAAVMLVPSLFTAGAPDVTDTARTFRSPSLTHPFGTDQLGRDVYTRVVHGARISLLTGIGAVIIGVGGGILLGLVSAAAGRVVDGVLMRFVDVLLAFPELLLALLVVAIIGRGSANVALAIGLAAVPHFARLVRGQAFAVIRSEYVEAARGLGVPPWRYLTRHVLPNVAGPLVVLASIGTGSAITAAAGLSILGLGPAAPSPEWGAMLADGQEYLGTAWWIAVFPGLAVVAVVLTLTLLGRNIQARAIR
ncbi:MULTISPECIES: ABC transporter permease [Protofrankia]|uniref:ABC-type transporter, integral membrane subunit n=1 Tax=Candidatus Protofrankia datiscae TaxID=2716812 RepID=F8B1G2_9ACTN|nr:MULTISPECIES: ABC transporter permease [Protofrankia]AEH09837.1 ABC-type transporter, integral membrane subunit [Candidatus Protofrankia datiscae]